ncbi:MAG: T9SS type A sorting domain-containing protein [Bacteroidetes bacterium]|nr:T9SS type A sorting domain-containing protein [Bacteroidota bacterium]
MSRSITITFIFLLTLLDTTKLQAQNAIFTDHGFIPVASISASSGAAEFQSAIYNNGDVFIATTDGIWKNNITSQVWSPAGLQGIQIASLFQHPDSPDKFYAGAYINLPPPSTNTNPLFISEDGGLTWNPATAPVNENYYAFAVRPGNPNHVYANVEAANIAVSADGGETWDFMNHNTGGYFGYQSCIAFTPLNPNQIYQGSENPMDCAWLGKYDIDLTDPFILSNFETVVDGQCGGGPWENRRPDELRTFANNSDNLYVGQEGALSKVSPQGLNQTEFLYLSNGEPDKPYSYIYAIWVDPLDTNHLIFGGALNNNAQPMQLYETYTEGDTFYRYTQTFDLTNPMVLEIVDIGGGMVAVVLNDQNENRVKLIVMEPQLLSNKHTEKSGIDITVLPVPTTDILTIQFNRQHVENSIVTITNSLGQIVYQQLSSSPVEQIDISHLSKGMYNLTVQFEDAITTQKIILN